jgi:penicillin-binding protein 1A
MGSRLGAVIDSSLRLFVALVVALLVVPPLSAAVGVATLLKAPLPGDLPEERPPLVALPSVVLDAEGNEIGVFRGFDITIEVTPDQIPQVLKDAVVAIEDRRFWEHDGVDLEGIARAARINLELGEIEQGGSTITQQYIKNVYLSGERTIERKAREALLATELENKISKEEILFRYLETAYFGSGAYGAGAAAQNYFAKSVDDLDISEAATLAGLIQAPTRLSPRSAPEAAEVRRRLVLQAMLDADYITEAEYELHAARVIRQSYEEGLIASPKTVIAARPPKGASEFPFFVDWVESDVLELFGDEVVYRGGLTIETTIQPDLQRDAEAAVRARLQETEYPVEMAAATIHPKTGHVLAMVGGRDYSYSQVNLALGGSTGFQPGSSFKPIVLATALSQGISPDAIYPAPAQWRAPGCGGKGCVIHNYDNKGRGRLPLRDALRLSVNTVFANLIRDVTIPATVDMARSLGLERIDPEFPYGISFALGVAESSPLEMASAYGTFANRGVRVEPTGILRVIDAEGNVLVDNTSQTGTRVLHEAVADTLADVMQTVVTDGTGKRAAVEGHAMAGKTGTAQAYRAAWFVGYTPDLATAVWMGHADRSASLYNINGVGKVTGGSHPAMAFAEIMTSALQDVRPAEFPEPGPLPKAVRDESTGKIVGRRQVETLVGPSDRRGKIPSDCGGPCEVVLVPSPPLTNPGASDPAPEPEGIQE